MMVWPLVKKSAMYAIVGIHGKGVMPILEVHVFFVCVIAVILLNTDHHIMEIVMIYWKGYGVPMGLEIENFFFFLN